MEILGSLVDRGVLAGAVALVADGDGVLLAETAGFADVEAGRPMRPDTLFWVASMTKPVTAAAVMMLVEEGRLNLDEPAERHLPGLGRLRVLEADGVERAPRRPITLRHLLAHTGGLRFLNSFGGERIDGAPLAETVERNLREPLLFHPGEGYLYSNEGIDAAGLIVERVSGKAFEDFLAERLFGPIGMGDTTFFPSPAQVARLARAYRPDPGRTRLDPVPRISFLTYPLYSKKRYAAPGGGLFSTASDMMLFCRMLLCGGRLGGRRFLSEASVREMARRQSPPGCEAYGLGCNLWADETIFGHGGACKTSMAVEGRVARVFMVQQAGEWGGTGEDAAQCFAQEARRRFPG